MLWVYRPQQQLHRMYKSKPRSLQYTAMIKLVQTEHIKFIEALTNLLGLIK